MDTAQFQRVINLLIYEYNECSYILIIIHYWLKICFNHLKTLGSFLLLSLFTGKYSHFLGGLDLKTSLRN